MKICNFYIQFNSLLQLLQLWLGGWEMVNWIFQTIVQEYAYDE